ncbi:hypothetical protein [Citrobacter braakii]|uniref:hypothetical protein n=1 Tax=Citrobacter braakii TaxID=57706 RepID=UPI0039B4A5C7
MFYTSSCHAFDHCWWHHHWHHHMNYLFFERCYLVGLLHDTGVQVGCFLLPPPDISLEAAQAPLF